MNSAIAQPVAATEASTWIYPACRVDCTAVPAGRAPRYPSDLRQEQWARLAPLFPASSGRGRPPTWCRRTVLDAIFHLADNGIKWRAMPVDFPPKSTVFEHFTVWREQGVWDQVHDVLRDAVRVREGRRREPTAAIVDSQSLRAAETVGKDRRGWDNGKKVGGTKRHIAVDVLGLLLLVHVTAASVQDRDAAFFLLQRLRMLHSKITLVWADSGYDYGELINGARKVLRVTVQIIRRTDDMTGFVLLPRRWVVERTLSWICQLRRCVRDYERRADNHEAMVTISMIMLMSRRLAKPLPRTA